MMKLRFLKIAKILAVAALAVGLTSCASKDKGNAATTGVKLTKNTGYQAASTSGPYLQNRDSGLPYDISRSNSVSVSYGPRNQKYVALTFDDGPNPQHTPRLLDMLRRRNVKATFYVIGKSVAAHPEIVRRTVAEGHEIGNHTWNHPNLKTLSDDKVSWELDKTRDAIISATGVQPRTMRPPYGSLAMHQREWIYRKYGYPTVLWDVDPLDWKKPGSSVVAHRLISGTRNGSILLVHDLHGQSVDAIPQTIDALLRQGYQFVTVSQLIALGAAQGM